MIVHGIGEELVEALFVEVELGALPLEEDVGEWEGKDGDCGGYGRRVIVVVGLLIEDVE